jgi:hypothetical protein
MSSQFAELTCLKLISLWRSSAKRPSTCLEQGCNRHDKVVRHRHRSPLDPHHILAPIPAPPHPNTTQSAKNIYHGERPIMRKDRLQFKERITKFVPRGPLMPACKCAITHETSCLRPRMQESLRRPPIADAQSGDGMYRRLVIGDDAIICPSSNNHNGTSRIRSLLAWFFMPSFIL